MDPKKVRVMLDWPRPTIVMEGIEFSGSCRVLSVLIEGFTCLTSPMTKLTRKGVSFMWDDTCE